MMRLYTDDLDATQLQGRLKSLLEPSYAQKNYSHRPPADPPSLKKRYLRTMHRLRVSQLLFSLRTWRMTGWNLRLLIRSVPILGPMAWRLWGRLTLRTFRQQTQAELHKLGVALQQQQQQQVQLSDDIELLTSRIPAYMQTPSPAFSEWYLALENEHRGSADDIEARLALYLPHLKVAQVGQAQWPVLDLGCGRGEWLTLLGREQLAAIGVDSNPAMSGVARQHGSSVVESDLIAYLLACEAESIGAVTAFQVIEHFDHNVLLELMRQAMRVLRPGGVLLLETPNPENIQVSAYSFWLDPTHVRPIPAPLLAHIASYFGFIDICIERSNPWRETMPLPNSSPAASHLNNLLYCGQDYALIARKPYAQQALPTQA